MKREIEALKLETVIESTVKELSSLAMSKSLNLEVLYAKVLYAFHTSDNASLVLFSKQFSHFATNEAAVLKAVTDLRIKIRKSQVEKVDIANLLEKRSHSNVPKGEIEFVCAIACQKIGLEKEAFEFYRAASESLNASGCHKKAVLCQLHMIKCKNRVYQGALLMSDYISVAASAKDAHAHSAAGTALTNIAREFQKLKSYELALKYIEEATTILKRHMLSSYQYYVAIAQRCEIYCDLKNVSKALTDYQELMGSTIPEVKNLVKDLTTRIEANRKQNGSGKPGSIDSWKKRLMEVNIKLSKNESILVESLIDESKTFDQLLDVLYPDGSDYDSKANRLRQLLFRVKKKVPGIIAKKHGYYSLEAIQKIA